MPNPAKPGALLTLEAGLERLLSAIAPLPSQAVQLADAGSRFLAETLTAAIDLPSYDNSAMDGYAVRAAEAVTGARLRLVGAAPAGHSFDANLEPGCCVRVFTGSPIPAGADAVVMQEDTVSAVEGGIEITDGVKPWENVRFRGEDVRRGSLLAEAGARISGPLLGLLAAQGISQVRAGRRPRVTLVPNGSELVPIGSQLRPGQVYESNTVVLRELVAGVGGEVDFVAPPPDEVGRVGSVLSEAFSRADVVITIGGASVGEHDLIRPAFEQLGGRLEFWKLALKPGKPFFFGTLGDKFLFGLPGNPVSAFVTGVLLVLPALRKLQGGNPAHRVTHATLGQSITNPDSRRHFVRVATDPEGVVRPTGPQASHLLRSLATADGLVDVAPGASLDAGATVPVIRW